MPVVTEPYPPGTPCWFDMTVTDTEAVRGFYGAVLGWQLQDNPWHYHRCLVDGKAVAAISMGEPEGQSNWTTYVATDDVAATLRAVEAAGGRVVQTAHQTPAGIQGIAEDPTGGIFALWQGESLVGSELAGEPGAPVWAELTSKDVPTAARFFTDVFGMQTEPLIGAPFEYLVLKVGERQVGGIFGGPDQRPSEGHGAWLVYFQVTDTDAAASAVVEHGGKLTDGPFDTPFGRMAFLTDPFGAHFAVTVPSTPR